MTTALACALLAQAVAVALLRKRLGRHWLRRPVTLLTLTSTVEMGVGPALLAIPSVGQYDNFARGIQRHFTDLADLIMSIAMLALVVAYLATRPERTVALVRPTDVNLVTRVLDWRLLWAACIPLAAITAAGRGYNNGTAIGQDTSLETDLVSTFFIVLIVVAAAAFLLRHGPRWFLLVVIAQSVLLALAGERTPILMDGIALVIMMLFAGVRLPTRQLGIAISLMALTVLAVSGVRTHQGRTLFYSNSGLLPRVSALTGGLTGTVPQGAGNSPGLAAQFAVRESAVDFAGGVLQSVSDGQPRLSPAYVPESLLLTVPRFLWPSKLAQKAALNPGQLEINDFGLQQAGFISGMAGLYIGFLSPLWLVIVVGVLGLVFGWFERWLLRELTPTRLILLAGSVAAALRYEAGLPGMLVQMRAAVALALTVKAVVVLRGCVRSRGSALAGATFQDPRSAAVPEESPEG